MRITFVKKILANGEPCPKCLDVEQRLKERGVMASIDHVAVADEREPASEGMELARRHGVEVAPFFLVEENSQTAVYTIYFKFVKEVLADRDEDVSAVDEAFEILRANRELDLI